MFKGDTALPMGLMVLLVSFWLPPLTLGLETEPHPRNTFLPNILNFQQPTGIRGTLRYIDTTERIIWFNWEQRSDARPLFDDGWGMVLGDATLAVHPTDSSQFEKLQHIPKGTTLEMVIQFDPEGNRRILSFQDLSSPPKIPL